MRQRHIHHLPVPNQSNLLMGMLSLSDLALKGLSGHRQRDLQDHDIASDSYKSSNELT
jgi:hypothetical protein